VFIELGINDKDRPGDHTTAENLRTMVNSIHAYSSSIKIGICLVIPPYLGDGKSADADYNHIFRLNQNDSLIAEFKNDSNVYIVPTNAALDARYAFPTTTTEEGDWMTNEVTKPTDQTHPSANGYYQLADMYYATLVCN
jgi:lysophospholipase L1-like esterase